MQKKLALLLFALTIILVAVGCGGPTGPVAVVDGEEITRSAFDNELEYELFLYEQEGIELDAESEEQVRLAVVDRLINNVVLRNAAQQAGAQAGEDEVNERLDTIIDRFEDEDEYHEALEDEGFTPEEYREVIAEMVMINQFFEDQLQLSEIEVTDEEIDEMVENYHEQFREEDGIDPAMLEEFFEHNIREAKADELRNEFIDQLRDSADIEYLDF